MVDRPAPDTVFGRVSSIVSTSPTLSAYETARKAAREHASGGTPKWSHSEAELRARLLRVAQGQPDPLDYTLHARTILPTASFDEAGPAGIALRIGVFRAIEAADSSEPVSVELLSSRWVRRTATLADTQHALQYLRAPEFNVALLHECTHDVTVRALVSFLLEWDDASLARFADGEGADFAPLLHSVQAVAREHEESLETGRTRLGMPAVSLVTACRVTLRRSALDAAVASAAAAAAAATTTTSPPLVTVPADASPTPALFHMAPRKRRRSGSSSDVDVAQYGKVRRRLLAEFDAVTDTNGTDRDEIMAEETNNNNNNADATSTADNNTADDAAVEPNNAVEPSNTAGMDADDDNNNTAADGAAAAVEPSNNTDMDSDDDDNNAAADGAAAAVEPSNNADVDPDDDFDIEPPNTDNFFTNLLTVERFYSQYYPLNAFRPCLDPIVRVDLLMTDRSHVLLRNHFRDVSRLAGAAPLSTERDAFCWSDRIADSFWEHFRAVAHAVVTNQLTDELIDAMRAPPAEEPPYSGAPLAAYEWRRQYAKRTYSYHPYDPNDGAAVLQARAAKAGNGAAANDAKAAAAAAADDDGMDDEDGAGAEAMLEERAKTAPLEGPWTDGSVKFITGHACSGKTSLLRELEQHGWRHYSRGDLGSFAGKAKSAATVATLYGAQQYAQSMPDVLGDRGTLDNLLWEFMMQAMATEHYPSTNGACNADDFIRMLRQFLDSTFNESAIAAFVAHKALIVVDPFCELNRIRQLRRSEEGDAFRARILNYSTVQCLGYYAIARLLGYPVIVPYLRMPPTTEEDGGAALSPYQFDVQIGCCFARNYFGTPSSCVYSELRRSRYRKPVDGPVPDFSYAVATGFYK